jgi:hypothetical protein
MVEHRILRVSRLATVISVAALLVLPAASLATHHGEEVVDQVVFRLTYQAAPVAGARAQVVAHMAMDDGEAIGGETVDFSRQVDFLGPRTILLGSASTDVNGDARLTIEPPTEAMTVIAEFAGDEHYLPVQQTIQVAAAAPAPTDTAPAAEPSLALISGLMPQLLLFAALGVWVLLVGLAALTALAIRRRGSHADS